MSTLQKRVRSVSLDDRSIPPGLSTLLDAADRLAVFVDTTNHHPPPKSAVQPGIGVLLDAATSVSPSKKSRLSTAISDDEDPIALEPHILLRLIPSAEELAEATTFRSRTALDNWYLRLRELYEYKAAHHDCFVPQKYPPNPALGIVRFFCRGYRSFFQRLISHIPSFVHSFVRSLSLSLLDTVGQQTTHGEKTVGPRIQERHDEIPSRQTERSRLFMG